MEKMTLEKETKDSLLQKYTTIFFVVAGYWLVLTVLKQDSNIFFRIVSIMTVFINKTLLSDINLNAPMFIALYQTLITAFICLGKKSLARTFPHHFTFPETNVFEIKTAKTVSIKILNQFYVKFCLRSYLFL